MHDKSASFETCLRMNSSSNKYALPWLEANRVKGTHEGEKKRVRLNGCVRWFYRPFLHDHTDQRIANHSSRCALRYYKCDQYCCYGPCATLLRRKDTVINNTRTVAILHNEHKIFAVHDIILLQLSTTVFLIYGGHCLRITRERRAVISDRFRS